MKNPGGERPWTGWNRWAFNSASFPDDVVITRCGEIASPLALQIVK